jgi:hypothetical protein
MTIMQESNLNRIYFRVLAVFYLVFGLITTFYPRLMHLFMTQRGIDASTSFSNNVWLHDGLDIISVAILLFAISTLIPSRLVLGATAVVALMPVVAILYSLAATSFWSLLFLVPAMAAIAFAVWGFALVGRVIPE